MASELMRTDEAREALSAVQSGRVRPEEAGELEAVLTGGMSETELASLLSDLRNEVQWRRESDIDCDYFDHRQLSAEQLAQLEEWGLPPAMADIIHPSISAVLGIQAQTRTDWQVDFGDDASEPVAKALGQKLADEERKTRADRSLSEAYAGQIKAGLHWIEVNRESNPFAPSRYRVDDVHRREIWWDWRSKRLNLSDGRYKVRRQWFDVDFLSRLFPNLRDAIETSFGVAGASGTIDQILQEGAVLSDRFGVEARDRTLDIESEEWIDQSRRRAVLFEIWYRVWKRGVIARIGDRTVKIDTKNPRHVALIMAQRITPEIAVYPEMRLSFWIGPHRVFDKPSPLPHDSDPYTPFWGFRADADKAPYGMIRGMRWPQDEINTRLSKMLSLLTSKRVIMEATALNPAVMDMEEFRHEAAQHNAVLVVADGALQRKRIIVEENGELSAQQFSVYQEMKQLVAEVSNIYAPILGKQQGGQSGVAINQLVEQGMTSLAEINDNFSWGQREVGEQLLQFIMADSTHPHQVTVGKRPTATVVPLNQKKVGEDGLERLENAVKYANVRVSLSEVPQTPTYRQRVFTMIAEAVKAMPPNLQAIMSPMMIEMSNLPGRKEAARFLRQQLGLPDPEAIGGEDPAMAAARQQFEPLIQQLRQQLAEAQGQVQQAMAAVDDKRADVAARDVEVRSKSASDLAQADAAKTAARAKLIEATGKAQAEVMRARAEAARQPEPVFDPKAITDGLMASLEKAVNVALAPVLKEVATMQGQLQAIGQRPQQSQASQQPAVVIEKGAFVVNPPDVTIEKGAVNVDVTVDAKSKPTAKDIRLSDDGKSATITPRAKE